jgi:hypothetical protein
MTTLPRCPICAAKIKWGSVSFASPFRCPNCRRQLKIPSSYFMVASWIDVVTSGSLAYILGFRGHGLLFATICILVPVIFTMAFLYRWLMPPKLKPYQPDYLTLDFLHEPQQGEADPPDTGPPKTR